MSPRDLDPEVLAARLARLDELLEILEGMRPIGQLTDPVARLAVERILTQSVEIAVDICSHVVVTRSGRGPATYRESVERAARLGLIPDDTAQELVRAVGMRNVLVHDYLVVDPAIVAGAAEAAPGLFGEFRRSVATWLLENP